MSYYYWPAPEDAPRERQSLDPNWKLVHINTCGTSRGVPAWVGNEATADKCRRPKGGAGMYLWNSWPNEAPWPRWSRRATLRWDTGTSDWNPVDHSRHLSTTSFNNERATSTMKSSAKGGPRKKKTTRTCPLKWAPTSNKIPRMTSQQRRPNLPLTRALSFFTWPTESCNAKKKKRREGLLIAASTWQSAELIVQTYAVVPCIGNADGDQQHQSGNDGEEENKYRIPVVWKGKEKILFRGLIQSGQSSVEIHLSSPTYHGLVARAKKASQVKASGRAKRL